MVQRHLSRNMASKKSDACLMNNAVAQLVVNRDEKLALFPQSLGDTSFGFAFAKSDPRHDEWQEANDLYSGGNKRRTLGTLQQSCQMAAAAEKGGISESFQKKVLALTGETVYNGITTSEQNAVLHKPVESADITCL